MNGEEYTWQKSLGRSIGFSPIQIKDDILWVLSQGWRKQKKMNGEEYTWLKSLGLRAGLNQIEIKDDVLWALE